MFSLYTIRIYMKKGAQRRYPRFTVYICPYTIWMVIDMALHL